MKLYVMRDYQNRNTHYTKGDTIDVSPEVAVFLMVDSPGAFKRSKPAPRHTVITEQAVEVKQ